MRRPPVLKSLSRTAEDAGTRAVREPRGPCSGRSAAPRWRKTRAGHARRVVWCCMCMRANSCLWVAGASIELSLVVLGRVVHGLGCWLWLLCRKKKSPVLMCLSIRHIEDRKSSDLVYKKSMNACVVMVWCVCVRTCD